MITSETNYFKLTSVDLTMEFIEFYYALSRMFIN